MIRWKGLRYRNESGQSLVEFTFLLPVLLFILLAIIQFGILYNNWESITDGARAGARVAVVSRLSGDPVAAAVTAVQNSAPHLDADDLDVTVAPSPPWTSGQQITVTVSYPYSLDLFGFVVQSGTLTSATSERVE